MSQSQGQFKLNMDGLLEVLAGSLYANPVVGLRELIQNAHDSCIRYSVEAARPHFRPKIHIETDPEAQTLTIHDNGAGLTKDEMEQYLITIGRSYTRELRDNLAFFETEKSEELIGQFGFGFLSAFMLASEITLQTQSWKPTSQPLRWAAQGGDSYTISEGNRQEHGTTITLQLRAEAGYLLDENLLAEKIRKFANFLPMPINLDGRSQPENEMIAPWDQLDASQAIAQYIQREFKMTPPLAVIQLQDHIHTLPDGDEIKTPLQGFVFIPDSTVASIREFGDLHVYIRKMFITDTERELLPPWAKFVRGLVESPSLHPTASRESVRRDENFIAIREALSHQLSSALQHIQKENPGLWRQIVKGHADVMTGWAVQNSQFFAQVADILTFRTSHGELTLPDYLQLTENKIFYTTREIKSLQEKVLAEGNEAPVIEAVWFAVRPFLEKYAALNGNLQLIPLDEQPTTLFQKVNPEPFSDLLLAGERLGIPVEIAAFAPYQLPALFILPKDAEEWLDAYDALDKNELDPAISGLVSSFLEEKTDIESLSGRLFLNARCSFIKRLSELAADDKQQQLAIELLYQIARLFSGKSMTAAAAIEAFTSITAVTEELLKS